MPIRSVNLTAYYGRGIPVSNKRQLRELIGGAERNGERAATNLYDGRCYSV
jgi:hypothetical protein